MVSPNWNLLYQGQNNFQNALARGVQMGDMMRQRREEGERRNALAAYDPNNPETLKPVMAAYPRLGMQLQQQQTEAQQAAKLQNVAARARQGDAAALDELFTLKPDLWAELDDRSRQQIKDSTSYMAQAGFQIGRLPEAQRAAAWAAAVQQAEAGGMDIPDYLENYNPDALNSVMAQAGKMEAYIKQFEPNYRVIPEGGTLVDTRSPQAVQQFAPGAQQNLPSVTTPQEAMSLPPGSQFILPDGRIGTVPGGPASAPGGFPGN